jgi:hypothetical protein
MQDFLTRVSDFQVWPPAERIRCFSEMVQGLWSFESSFMNKERWRDMMARESPTLAM